MSAKKLFIVAGEASGDAHAARLIRALKTMDPDLHIEGLGGEEMRQAGCHVRTDLVSFAVMGFLQVAKNLPFFRRLLKDTILYLRQSKPDALVLVDYPGFNLRLAAAGKKLNIPVAYYISPQVWAWRPRRIYKIARSIDKMIVILPFEEQLYKSLNVDVVYAGHPLLDSISETGLDTDFLRQVSGDSQSCIIGLLPGSRTQELRDNLPVMLETAEIILQRMPHARFLIPCSSRGKMELTRSIIGERSLPITITIGKMYEVASCSRCCIVASGTATLEVGYFLTPLIVVYRTNPLTWLLGRKFLKIPHISLVNILAGEEIVPEMLQSRMRPDLLAKEAVNLCHDGEIRQKMIDNLRLVRERLGQPGASVRAAQAVWELLNRKKLFESSAA
jgi:lipid-A-disaccharide synthase